MFDPVYYNLIISAFCFVFNSVAVVALGIALISARNGCLVLFFLATLVSIVTSSCNLLSGVIRVLDFAPKYKDILMLNYQLVTITEPVALLALYIGLIYYAFGFIRKTEASSGKS